MDNFWPTIPPSSRCLYLRPTVKQNPWPPLTPWPWRRLWITLWAFSALFHSFSNKTFHFLNITLSLMTLRLTNGKSHYYFQNVIIKSRIFILSYRDHSCEISGGSGYLYGAIQKIRLKLGGGRGLVTKHRISPWEGGVHQFNTRQSSY